MQQALNQTNHALQQISNSVSQGIAGNPKGRAK